MKEGADYEAAYDLDAENKEKLRGPLENEGLTGTMEAMIPAYFREYPEKAPFSLYGLKKRCAVSAAYPDKLIVEE